MKTDNTSHDELSDNGLSGTPVSKRSFGNSVFKCSLLMYPTTILLAVFLGTIVGIDSGWPMPAWSDGTKMYGMQAIISYLIIFCVAFSWVYIPIIVYQVGYIICKILFAVRDVYFKHK